jgi:hypothetical protein
MSIREELIKCEIYFKNNISNVRKEFNYLEKEEKKPCKDNQFYLNIYSSISFSKQFEQNSLQLITNSFNNHWVNLRKSTNCIYVQTATVSGDDVTIIDCYMYI